ncbi:MAG: alkane 1-monooxygenase, partial [Pseudomonadota bacterium]
MFLKALPFWLSVTFVPLLALAAVLGEAWALLIPVYGWLVMSVLDAFAGLNEANEDTETPSAELFWYKLVTWVWLPIQLVLIFGLIVAGTRFDHLGGAELA